jgi:preprotein translocase subunit SecA
MLARVELAPEGPADQPPPDLFPPPRPIQMYEQHPEPEMALAGPGDDAPPITTPLRRGPAPMPVAAQPMRAEAVDPNDPATWHNAARNGQCPCGSGKKYKHCHGKLS